MKNKMEQELHFIQDVKLREALQTIGVLLGIVGVVVAILSLIY